MIKTTKVLGTIPIEVQITTEADHTGRDYFIGVGDGLSQLGHASRYPESDGWRVTINHLDGPHTFDVSSQQEATVALEEVGSNRVENASAVPGPASAPSILQKGF